MPVACGGGAGGSLTEQSCRKTTFEHNLFSKRVLGCCARYVSCRPFKLDALMWFRFSRDWGRNVCGVIGQGKNNFQSFLFFSCCRWLLLACPHVILHEFSLN